MIEVKETNLPGVKIITPTFFEDFRGQYIELYNKELYKSKGIDIDFVEEDLSVTTKYALKGIHGDDCTTKLVSCLYGSFYLVVVNYDQDSEYFGEWQSFTLSDTKRMQILIPPKYGNGHISLTNKCLFYYKQSYSYDINRQFSIRYDDDRFNIFWPVKPINISRRDQTGDKFYVEK